MKEIDRSYEDIGDMLKNKQQKLNTREVIEAFLKTNRLILAFFAKTIIEDHRKIEKIWPAYQVIMWISGVLGISIISLIWALITGRAELIIK